MRKRNAWTCACACLLVLTSSFAAAQTAADSDDEQATSASAGSEAGSDVVYTTEYLQQQYAGKGLSGAAVYTNDYLTDQFSEPEQAPGAFTNEDLAERYGNEVGSAAPAAEGDGSEAADDTGTGEATPSGETAPAMSAEERAQRIAEIDGELERLDRRLLAIRNPLLAGTVPPTDEERADEKDMDNLERLRRTEAKIDELKTALEELRSTTEGDDQ